MGNGSIKVHSTERSRTHLLYLGRGGKGGGSRSSEVLAFDVLHPSVREHFGCVVVVPVLIAPRFYYTSRNTSC